jgi:galactokinase
MTFAEQLAERGFGPAEAAAKADLFHDAIDALQAVASERPTHAVWVPGRLEVFGKHTDYAGGHTLVAAVPRGFGFAARGGARPPLAARIYLQDVVRNQDLTIATSGAAASAGEPDGLTGWRRYAATVVRRLSRNFPGAALDADIVFASDLPSASGMSSSSALMVGLADLLVRIAGIVERPEWIENVRTPADAAGYYACIENGLSFGTLAGDAGVGTHGGSEDHVAILTAAAGHLGAWRFVPIAHVANVRVPESWQFVIASSGVAARKTGEARESYNRLSRLARAALETWNGAKPPQPSLRNALVSEPSAPDRLRELLYQKHAAAVARGLEQRLMHFLREDARVLPAVDAFQAADRQEISALTDASQHDAETLLDNQLPETIALARSARSLGAFAASSFGAGFGGSVWALIERERAAHFADAWLADYRGQFPARTSATTFLASPGPSLIRLEY